MNTPHFLNALSKSPIYDHIIGKFPIFLAPMEGVMDFYMRKALCELGGIDICVSEFIRVTDQTLPDKVFYRDIPELKNFSMTENKVPVIGQLLGGDPKRLAEHALILVRLGSRAVDLNFGCPAKIVNRHDGGATLLKSPDRIFKILKEIRQVLPSDIPLSAKIRLGFDNKDLLLENSLAAQEAGAQWLTVHCRTKTQMYQPPVDWAALKDLKNKINIPIIANGDIFTIDDAIKCIGLTDCHGLMLGRGMLRDPYLANKIRKTLNLCDSKLPSNENLNFSWQDVSSVIDKFHKISLEQASEAFAKARKKQWLRELAKGPHPEAKLAFEQFKTV